MKTWLFLFVFSVFFAACNLEEKNNSEKEDELIQELLEKIENRTISLEEKLVLTYKVDSLALEQKDQRSHLVAQKKIATIYLKQKELKLAKKYFENTVMLADNLQDFEAKGIALNNLGIIEYLNQNYNSAEKYYIKANKIFETKGYQYRLAQGNINLAIVYKDQGAFEKAYKLSLKGAKILEAIDSTKDLSAAYTNIGNILKDLYRSDDALHYHFLALQMRQDCKDSARIASSLHNIANVYRIKKKYKKALAYYGNALNIKTDLGLVKSRATTLDNIGEVYCELHQYSNAGQYFNQALRIRRSNNNIDGILTTLNKLTLMHIMQKDYKQAEEIALHVDSLVSSKIYLKQRIRNAGLLSDIYMYQKQYDLAAQYARLGLNFKDSLYQTNLIDTVLLLNEKNKIKQKEKEVSFLKQLQDIQHKQIRGQVIFIVILVALLILLSIAAYLLFRTYKRVKRANKKIELLLKELNHRVKNNLQIVSDMLNLQMDNVSDPNKVALLQSSINRIESMNIIHTLLYQEEYSGYVEMNKFIETLINNLLSSYEKQTFFLIEKNIDPISINIDIAIPLGLIINELVTNIMKYGKVVSNTPVISISLSKKNMFYKLEIADTFAQWDIHKAKAINNGLGLFLIETLAKQIKAKWSFLRNENENIQVIEFKI